PFVTPVTADVVVRAHPVVPFELVIVRSNPPWNHPHVTPAAFRRSPMFLLLDVKKKLSRDVQTSPDGCPSPMALPPAMSPAAAGRLWGPPVPDTAPKVLPAIRLSAPGMEGPNVVLNELSSIAKFCA